MQRRDFFGGMAAVAVGAFALPHTPAADRDPRDPRKDAKGFALAHVYRQHADGEWREIKPEDVKDGDRVILVGMSKDRLFKCEAFTTASDHHIGPDGDGRVMVAPGSVVELRTQPTPGLKVGSRVKCHSEGSWVHGEIGIVTALDVTSSDGIRGAKVDIKGHGYTVLPHHQLATVEG